MKIQRKLQHMPGFSRETILSLCTIIHNKVKVCIMPLIDGYTRMYKSFFSLRKF